MPEAEEGREMDATGVSLAFGKPDSKDYLLISALIGFTFILCLYGAIWIIITRSPLKKLMKTLDR